MSRPLSLVHHVRLCRVACAVARADSAALEASLMECLHEPGLDPEVVAEAILQGIPYSGFPGAVEALGLWRSHTNTAIASDALGLPVSPTEPPTPPPTAGLDRGAQVFAEIYGDLAPRVRAELRRRHPHLEAWIISFAYGGVMAGSRLALLTIEALGVASLLVQARRPPLHSHLRGALRTGWSSADLNALITELESQCDAETLAFARSVIRREAAT
ncbi:MAG: hypothetical protein AB7O52_01815 [Planctomycetota bacterium]